MTASQLAGLTLTNLHSNPNAAAGNPLCTWSDETSGDSFGVTWMSASSQGLSSIYAQKSSQGYFQPTTVDGYPAVYTDVTDLRPSQCSLSVGTSDSLFFIAKYDSQNAATKSEACQLVELAASDVIKNLGGS